MDEPIYLDIQIDSSRGETVCRGKVAVSRAGRL